MKLQEWLSDNQIPVLRFATENGIAQSTLHRYLSAERKPSAELALQIERGTKGAVSKEFIMWGEEKKKTPTGKNGET